MVKIRTTTADRLTKAEIAVWSAIQRAEPVFASPYFRPEFIFAVAAVRKTVEIGVLEEDGQPIGFFPYERLRFNRGRPVGTLMSDYHGVIAPKEFDYNPVELVRSCGLSSWRFNHLVSPRPAFDKFIDRYADSPYMDVSQGFDEYERGLPTQFRTNLRRRRRKVEREIGPLRFEPATRDRSIFSALIDWKIEQYQRTSVLNVLRLPWTVQLLEHLLEVQHEHFTPLLSALYAGDKLLAIHYGLRSGNLMHSWFPAFNRDCAQYAPGLLLFMQILREAPVLGITRLELGKGTEEYKRKMQSGLTPVAQGAVEAHAPQRLVRHTLNALRRGARASSLHKLAAVQKVAQLFVWLDTR